MPITDGYLCRAIRYEFSAAPIVARACWCRVCQYIGAGSGNVMQRRFCRSCGGPASTIWTSQAPSWAGIEDTLPRSERQPPPAT